MTTSTSSSATVGAGGDFVVCGRQINSTETGYLHSGGYFVGLDDAHVMPLNDAIAAAQKLQRSIGVDASSVKVVPIVNGQIDLAQAASPTDIAFDEGLEDLARELQALDATVLAKVLAAMDKDAIRALRAAGIQMSGVRAGNPPRHEDGGLT